MSDQWGSDLSGWEGDLQPDDPSGQLGSTETGWLVGDLMPDQDAFGSTPEGWVSGDLLAEGGDLSSDLSGWEGDSDGVGEDWLVQGVDDGGAPSEDPGWEQ